MKDDRRAVIGELCCLGAGTRVMGDARVERSVIGRNCVIQPGALIQDSFIMDSVTVGAGMVLSQRSTVDSGTRPQ